MVTYNGEQVNGCRAVITITNPVGGECFNRDNKDQINIQWTTVPAPPSQSSDPDAFAYVRLWQQISSSSTGASSTWLGQQTSDEATEANIGEYRWTIPTDMFGGTSGGEMTIRVINASDPTNTCYGESKSFSIGTSSYCDSTTTRIIVIVVLVCLGIGIIGGLYYYCRIYRPRRKAAIAAAAERREREEAKRAAMAPPPKKKGKKKKKNKKQVAPMDDGDDGYDDGVTPGGGGDDDGGGDDGNAPSDNLPV